MKLFYIYSKLSNNRMGTDFRLIANADVTGSQ